MPNDFLNVETYLTDEARMTRDALREFLSQPRVVEMIRRCHKNEEPVPLEFIKELAGLGIFGIGIDGYTCEKLDAISYGVVMQELERCDSALRSIGSVQNGLVMFPIAKFGSEEQKQYWLPRLRTAEAIGCFGLTEHHGGSNPAGMKITATEDSDFWILNGSKVWATNGTIADVAVVWAKTPEGIRGFLVPRQTEDTPGFSASPIIDKDSLRASASSILYFNNCRIPRENLLPGTEIGVKAALMCLTEARYGIVWGAIGPAEACYEMALEFAKTRAPFGAPIASKQLIQAKLVEMEIGIANAKLLAVHLAHLKDRGELHHTHISAGKLQNVRIAQQVVSQARGILASEGIMQHRGIMRHLMNLETVETYEGTEQMHTLIIGKHLTGFDAF